MIADPVSARYILTHSDTFKRTDITQNLATGIFKYALFFMPTDDIWKKHRRLLETGFGYGHLKRVGDVTGNVMGELFGVWEEELQKQEKPEQEQQERKVGKDGHDDGFVKVDMLHISSCITADVLGKIAFSYDYHSVSHAGTAPGESQAEEKLVVLQLIKRILKTLSWRFVLPKFFWGFAGISDADAEKVTAEMRKHITDAVESKTQKLAATSTSATSTSAEEPSQSDDAISSNRPHANRNSGGGKSKFHLDILDRLLDNSNWTNQEIQDEILALFGAGNETTASSITFTIYLLSKHPESVAKLREELDSILGPFKKTNETNTNNIRIPDLDINLLSKFTYTDQIIKESLRLFPIVPELANRIVTETTTIPISPTTHIPSSTPVSSSPYSSSPATTDNVTLAKSTVVRISLYHLHRNPHHWPSPNKFIPERWDTASTTYQPPAPGTYLPFGEGPHICIGQRFAVMEIKVVLVCLYYFWDVEMVEADTAGGKDEMQKNKKEKEEEDEDEEEEDERLNITTNVTMALTDGLKVRMRRRRC
jgi:cytochrome P450